MNESTFKFYSVGIVLSKGGGTVDTIKVIPIEKFPNFKGNPLDKVTIDTKYTNELLERNGVLTKGYDINAKWIPLTETHRMSVPDVFIGERVMLYSFGDSEKIFWSTMFHSHDIRGVEHIVEGISNSDTQEETLSKDNTYWKSMDAVEQEAVLIHTPTNRGEFTTHELSLDIEKSVFTYTDGVDVPNRFFMESQKDKFTLETNEDVYIRTKRVHVVCDEYLCDAKDSFTINTKKYTLNTDTSEVNAKDSHKVNTKAMTINATNTFELITKSLTVKTQMFDVTAMTLTMKGNSFVNNFTSNVISGISTHSALISGTLFVGLASLATFAYSAP